MKRKVLHIIGGMGWGGAPIFIINNLKYVDGTKLQFDFLCRKDNCAYDDIIKQHGVIFILFQTFRAIFFQTLLKHSGSLENMHLNMRPCMYMLTHCFTFYHLF